MNKFLTWFRHNMLVPVIMAATAAVGVSIYQSMEIDGRHYRTLRNTFISGTDRYRQHVAEAVAQGSISNWTYTDLLRDFWNDSRSLDVSDPDDATKAETERNGLLADIRTQRRLPK